MEKFQGLLCDGLVVGFLSLNEGLEIHYPEGKVDSPNTRIVSKGSPCLADASIYLCGSRYQYYTFFVNNELDGIYIIQRIDNYEIVSVHLNKVVKPTEIDLIGKKPLKVY